MLPEYGERPYSARPNRTNHPVDEVYSKFPMRQSTAQRDDSPIHSTSSIVTKMPLECEPQFACTHIVA